MSGKVDKKKKNLFSIFGKKISEGAQSTIAIFTVIGAVSTTVAYMRYSDKSYDRLFDQMRSNGADIKELTSKLAETSTRVEFLTNYRDQIEKLESALNEVKVEVKILQEQQRP